MPWEPMGQIPTEIFTLDLQNSGDLQIPRYKTEFAKKGYHYAALKSSNDIPVEMREPPTLDRFKKQLKRI